MCPAGASLPPGTHTIPLSQLQTHSLAIQCPQTQNSHSMTSTSTSSSSAVPAHTQPAAQATLFRLPAAVSLTGQCVSDSLSRCVCVCHCGGCKCALDLHATAFLNYFLIVVALQVTQLMQKIRVSSKH